MQVTTTATTTRPLATSDAEAYWTRERVYVGAEGYVPTPGATIGLYPLPPRPNLNDERNPLHPRRRSGFTEEFRTELLRETDWQYIDSYSRITAEEEQIIRDGGKCPRCSVDGYNLRLKGSVTGIVIKERVKCLCKFHKTFWSVWNDEKMVPERFRSVALKSLVPVRAPTSKLPIERQRTVIATLQGNPEGSYLLTGDAGTGKTHFSFGLFRHAVHAWAQKSFEDDAMWERSVFRFNTKAILDQQVAWVTRENGDNTKEPDLTPHKIKKLASKGHRVCLFLDELDKFNATKFKMDFLFELVDAVYETKGQVVAVSNATMPKLRKIWAEFDSCDAIIRRICGKEADGSILEFRAGKE